MSSSDDSNYNWTSTNSGGYKVAYPDFDAGALPTPGDKSGGDKDKDGGRRGDDGGKGDNSGGDKDKGGESGGSAVTA
ncbi:hypothetical protein QBC41DRAFT_305257 [Cercophora samala]|uniref:Uncharacterized protein n=1 Tax=Cercophora samala TaxID=330535 RepID=A0AA39ZA70_9PEZI|nr:hypothetical protein QBC41DRAFT_305257 [Cercophora samala]